MGGGGRIFYLRNKSEWKDFLEKHRDYDFFISNNCGYSESVYYHPQLKGFSTSFKKIIIHSHLAKEFKFKPRGKIEQIFEATIGKIQFRGYNNIIKWACSDAAGKWIFGKNANFEVIKNGIFPERFAFNDEWRKEIRNELNINDSDYVIGNVGRIHFQKNQSFLIDIFPKIKKIIPNSKLVIVGTINQKHLFNKLQRNIKHHGLSSSIIFVFRQRKWI